MRGGRGGCSGLTPAFTFAYLPSLIPLPAPQPALYKALSAEIAREFGFLSALIAP